MQITSTNRSVFSNPKPVAKLGFHQKRQTQDSTPAVRGIDFLRHRFQPKVGRVHSSLGGRKKVEQGFFQSLSLLSDYYKLKPIEMDLQLFPINIHKCIEDVNKQIKALNRNLYLSIYSDEKGSIVFETEQHIWGGNKLYYLPVEPLYKLCFVKEQKASKDLLLSIFSYLYQTVKVAYFTKKDSYLYYQYDMVADWMREGDDEGCTSDDVEAEVDHMNHSGDVILYEIRQSHHLEVFAERLIVYNPKDDVEVAVQKVSKLAYDLMTEYPNRSFNDNIVEHETDDEDYGIISPEHYLSFFWNYNGMFYDQVWDAVDNDLHEYTNKDESIIFRFDGSPLPEKNYEFEARVLDLVEELCDVLNDLDYE